VDAVTKMTMEFSAAWRSNSNTESACTRISRPVYFLFLGVFSDKILCIVDENVSANDPSAPKSGGVMLIHEVKVKVVLERRAFNVIHCTFVLGRL